MFLIMNLVMSGSYIENCRGKIMLSDLRKNFELLAKNSKFPVERNEHGEYKFHATYNMWVGYWMAKVDSGELIESQADWVNANN